MFERKDIAKYILILSFVFFPSLLRAETGTEKIPHLPKYILHYVSAGETLHDISGYYLANPRRWREIYELNKEKIDNTEKLKPGVGLIIPLIGEPPPYPTIEEYRKRIGTFPEDKKKGGATSSKAAPTPTQDGVSVEALPDKDKEGGGGTFSVVEPPPAEQKDEGEKEISPDKTEGAGDDTSKEPPPKN